MFGVNMKRELKVFGYMFKVQFMYWSQNIMNLFLGLGVSLYTMVCWLAFKQNDPFLMISGLCVGMVRNSMYIHLKATGDFKANHLYERYDMAPINPVTRWAAAIVFNIFSTAAIVLFMFIIAIIFFPAQRTLLSYSNQGIVWEGLILTWATSLVTCYFIILFVGHRYIGQMIGLFLYFSTMYFLGLGFPFAIISQVDWLSDILYLHPFRFAMNITQAGFINNHFIDFTSGSPKVGANIAGSDLFNPTVMNPNYVAIEDQPFVPGFDPAKNPLSIQLHLGYGHQTWLPFFLAIVVIAVYGLAAYFRKYFSLSFHKRDKYGRFIVNKSSSRYLHHIKDAVTEEELTQLHKQRIAILEAEGPDMSKIVEQAQKEIRLEEMLKLKVRKKREKIEKQAEVQAVIQENQDSDITK